jgi:Icc-related predicted phosphoesterase
MRLWIFSDLHIDFAKTGTPPGLLDDRPDHDVVVIAGDIRENMAKGVEWIANAGLNEKPVVYVCGNHECYGRDRAGAVADAQLAIRDGGHRNIHILQDAAAHIDGVTFVGATLWTDYRLDGEAMRPLAMRACQDMMQDHSRIGHGTRMWLPADAAVEHEASRQYIGKVLDNRDGPVVVVTHHCPSIRSVAERYRGTIINTGFASHLDDLVSRAALWVHGHTHHCFDYAIGDCRVICNPRGYGGENRAFNPRLVVEV